MALCWVWETDLAEWKDNCIFAVGAVCAVVASGDKAHKTLYKRENQPVQSGLETAYTALLQGVDEGFRRGTPRLYKEMTDFLDAINRVSTGR